MLDPDNTRVQESLYRRLGGYDGIAAFVADLMPRLRGDPRLGVYWKGKSHDGRRRQDKLVIEFMCAAFDGPVLYAGPDMRTSHDGLGITEEEWAIMMGHIAAALDATGVAAPDQADFLAAADGLKWDIVARPPAAPPA